MMGVQNMRLAAGACLATFEVEIHGTTLRGFSIIRNAEGELLPVAPRDHRGALIEMPRAQWLRTCDAALDAYDRLAPDDAGLRRVLGVSGKDCLQ